MNRGSHDFNHGAGPDGGGFNEAPIHESGKWGRRRAGPNETLRLQ